MGLRASQYCHAQFKCDTTPEYSQNIKEGFT